MDFSAAIKANSRDEYQDLVRPVLEDACWEDYLQDSMENGGWPDDAHLDGFSVEKWGDDDEEVNVLLVSVYFTELCGTGCADIGKSHSGTADLRIEIWKTDGSVVNVDTVESDVSDDFRVGDYT